MSSSGSPSSTTNSVLSAVLGFPRMGRNRELKKATESYWAGKTNAPTLLETARTLRLDHWKLQADAGVDLIPSNDFSLYDQVLDHSVLFNVIPPRYQNLGLSEMETMFAMGRGLQRSANESQTKVDVPSQEMVKWFDSNYHYLRPEFSPSTDLKLGTGLSGGSVKPVVEFLEAMAAGFITRPVLIGPVTFLYLGKPGKDAPAGFEPLSLLSKLLPVYAQLIQQLVDAGAKSIQIDEPSLVFDLPAAVSSQFKIAYEFLANAVPTASLMFSTYFGEVTDASILKDLPVAGIHIDLVRAPSQLDSIFSILGAKQILSLGVVDGRNIWKTNLQAAIGLIQSAVSKLSGERVIVSTSSSLLHTPHTIESEKVGEGIALRAEVRDWFAFAKEKCIEVALIARAIRQGGKCIQEELNANSKSLAARAASATTTNADVRKRQLEVTKAMHSRISPFAVRQQIQQRALQLPLFPTTTIGSFPQTKEIRLQRDRFAKKLITSDEYEKYIKEEIRMVVAFQEECNLDIFVHGEPERNDMVQYFLERMEGCTFTTHGWVQSYGSRCVRPPIIIGDVSRPNHMTVKESVFAASLTSKPMKGMLTGPITCLRWSFPRDDLPLASQCQQLALAIRDEVRDLEAAKIKVIQIDEPALREGLPLRVKDQPAYLEWAVNAFKLASCTVSDATQIHSHFCYSDFNEIFDALQALDADVITIESAKSDLKLLSVIKSKGYTNQIGPGVYDIHSPRVPSMTEILERIEMVRKYVPKQLLWINPDCGLKTRGWKETKEAIINMVQAAKKARENS